MNRPASNPYNVSKDEIKRIQARNRLGRDEKLEARLVRIEESIEWLTEMVKKRNDANT